MAFSDESNMVMPVSPMYGNGGNGGFGFGGDSWAWIILLLLLGWGNNGNNGFNGGGINGLYPWMNQADITTSGFQNSALNSAIAGLQTSVTSGFGDIQTALCGGFAGVNANIANGFAQAEIGANSRQMANMNQIYGLSTQLAQCCCDNRLATANLGSDIAREACATRTNDTQNTQAILNAVNNGIQSIKDQICNDKIDSKNEKIVELQNQLNMATLRESQTMQNALITQGFTNEVDALYNRLSNCPVPTTPVYGRTPIFTCQNNGCGCGQF